MHTAYQIGYDTAQWIAQHRHKWTLMPRAPLPQFDVDALTRFYGTITPEIEQSYRDGYREGLDRAQGNICAIAQLMDRMN